MIVPPGVASSTTFQYRAVGLCKRSYRLASFHHCRTPGVSGIKARNPDVRKPSYQRAVMAGMSAGVMGWTTSMASV